MRRTSFWNNITNKHYWPKTGRSSQKQNMYQSNLENQIDPKTNYKISYQTISMKHLKQPNIKVDINKLRRTSYWNNITNKNYQSSQNYNLENQINPKNKLQNFLPKDINETSWIIFNQISKLISIPIEKNFLLKQHNK